MTDKDIGPRFDHDPNLNRPLKPETRQFLQAFRDSEFKMWDGNLMLVGDVDRYSESGRREALWSRAFVEKLFSLQTLNEANSLLRPWADWGAIHSQIWARYWTGQGEGDTNTRYKGAERQFQEVEIPSGIRTHQGDLSDEELKSQAHSNYFARTREIKEAIDLIEGMEEPVSISTVFRVQRVLDRPFLPQLGLKHNEDTIRKDEVKRIEQDGQMYVAFEMEGDPEDLVVEDISDETHWQRWDQMEVGSVIRYIRKDPETKQKQVETGTVYGFNLGAAGEAMIYEPSVKNAGVIVIESKTGFFRLPLVSDVRLDSEEITVQDLESPQPQEEPVAVWGMNFQSGESLTQEFPSTDAVFGAIVEVIKDTIEGNDRIEQYDPKIVPEQN